MIGEMPSPERSKPKAMIFGYKEPRVICDFSNVESSQFHTAYDLALDKFGNKAGSLGRYASLEDAQQKTQNKVLSVYEWDGKGWVEK